MDARQTARLDAAKRVQLFNSNTDNATQLATIPDYAQEQTEFDTIIQQIIDATNIQAQDNTGIASNKDSLQKVMVNTVVKYALRGVVLAHRAGETELEKGIDHPVSYYTKDTADTSVSRATATKALIKNKLAILTNITAANVTEMETAIANFVAVKDTPTVAHQTQKVQGSDQIDPLLDEADTHIQFMGYLIHSYFPDSTLAQEFDLISKLLILGVRHTGVNILLEDAQTAAPITNGTATKAKTGQTDTGGIASFATSRFGKQTFKTAAPGYQDQDITIQVNRGTLTEVVVKMVKG